MGLMDEIGKKLSQTGKDTVKKAKSVAETVKINNQISEEQRALNTFYTQIGEKYYSIYKDAPADEFTQICDRITAGIIRIAELQTEAQRLKNTRLCPKCGAVCPLSVQFCSACGTRLPKVEPPTMEPPAVEPPTVEPPAAELPDVEPPAAEPLATEPSLAEPGGEPPADEPVVE